MDPTTASFTVAVACTGVLATMVFVLGLNVSRWRGVTAKQGGEQLPTDPASPLMIAQRAHGNATEYVPTLIVLFLLLGAQQDSWWAVALIVGATLSRLLHALGTLSLPTLDMFAPVRFGAAMSTYLFGVALAVAAVVSVA